MWTFLPASGAPALMFAIGESLTPEGIFRRGSPNLQIEVHGGGRARIDAGQVRSDIRMGRSRELAL